MFRWEYRIFFGCWRRSRGWAGFLNTITKLSRMENRRLRIGDWKFKPNFHQFSPDLSESFYSISIVTFNFSIIHVKSILYSFSNGKTHHYIFQYHYYRLWILPFIDIYVQIKKFGRKIVMLMLVSYCNVQDVSITGAIFPLLQFFSFDSNIDKKVFIRESEGIKNYIANYYKGHNYS